MSLTSPETEAPESERQITLDLLKAITPQWLDLKLRNERTGGLDAQLHLEYHGVYKVVDGLLEQYFALGGSDGSGA